MKFLAVPGLPSLSQDWPLLCLFILYSTHSHVIFLLSRMPEIKNFSLISHVGQDHILASFHTEGFSTHLTWRDFGLISHGGIFDSFHTGVGSYFRLISHGGIFYLFYTEGFWTHFTQRDFVLISHGGILESIHTGVGSYFSIISHGGILDSFHTGGWIILQSHFTRKDFRLISHSVYYHISASFTWWI